MVSITISVPDEVRDSMKRFPEVNWSGLVRKSIIETAMKLMLKEKMLKQLDREKDFNEWAVNIIRQGREK